MRQFIKIATIAALIVLPLVMSACNTVEGAGKDTKDAGQAVQNAADKNK